MSKVRTFVATPVIELESLKRWVLDFKRQPVYGKVKWTDPGLWHLTFKFIGDIKEEQLSSLKDSLNQAMDGCSTGKINFEGLGYFGSAKNPKVIWAGIKQSKWLEEIRQRVEYGVSVFDLPEEDRPFRPHLTLARIKYLKNSCPLLEALKQKENFEWGSFEVSRMVLYKSQLTSSGPVYSKLESFKLIGR